MCECLANTEKLLTEKMLEINPGSEVVERVELQNTTFLMPSFNKVPYNPALGKYKKGNRVMKFTMSMIYTFCPFCGEKYKKEEEEQK